MQDQPGIRTAPQIKYLLGVDGHVENRTLVAKQRVLRDDEDPLAEVKNFQNFSLLC